MANVTNNRDVLHFVISHARETNSGEFCVVHGSSRNRSSRNLKSWYVIETRCRFRGFPRGFPIDETSE